MEKQFVPCVLSIKLKNIGFDEPCFARYRKGKFQFNTLGRPYKHNSQEIVEGDVAAPFWQQAFEFVCQLISEAELDPEGELSVTFEAGNFCLERVIWMDYEGFAIEPLTQSSEESLLFLINKLEKKK